MNLNLQDLAVKEERTYFIVALVVSILVWILLCVSIVGFFIALALGLVIWAGNGLLSAQLKSDCVQITEKQLPDLYKTFTEVCGKFALARIPDIYIVQAGGFLNAFAMRHAGRDFVVLYSDIVEAYRQDSEEIRFLLGHEIGHVKLRHILKRILIMPGLFLPLLGPAYRRACERSCDRFGAFATRDINGAIKAMMILSGGKEMGKALNAEVFSEQAKTHRGFFVSWYELISGYPTLSQRVASLIALRDSTTIKFTRNPVAYLFAFFSIGAQGGNFFIVIVVIGILVSLMVPALFRMRNIANHRNSQIYSESYAPAPLPAAQAPQYAPALPWPAQTEPAVDAPIPPEADAKRILSSLSAATEQYYLDLGKYPDSAEELIKPPSEDGVSIAYIDQDYCGSTQGAFQYTCEFTGDNYKFTASPVDKTDTGLQEIYITKDGYGQ